MRVELRRRLRAAANVAHPNLGVVLDIAQYRDLEVVAYEDFAGRPIIECLEQGVPAVEGLRYAVEVTSAVARAHARGVPHGRITLPNIMIARDDSVRVLDLGLPRPRELAFLIDDVPDLNGVYHPVRRDTRKPMWRDIAALGEVVRVVAGTGPEDAPDHALRLNIADAVEEAIAPVLENRWSTAAGLHAALVEVARRTPADARHGFELLPRPERQVAVSQARAAVNAMPDHSFLTPPATTPTRYRPTDKLPFSLIGYDERDEQAALRRRDQPPSPPSLHGWSAAAFEVPDFDDDDWEDVFEPLVDPPESAIMTEVFLHPAPLEDRVETVDAEPGPDGIRFWPHIAGALAVGILLAIGLFSLNLALRPMEATDGASGMPPPLVEPDASAVAEAPVVSGTSPSRLTAGARPVAREGQPAGTLVVTVVQDSVSVRIGNSRPEPAPVTWDNVPAARHILHVERPGFATRVDTVIVRPGLTTTRFYVLVEAQR
jgi:hypothetical protein